MVAVNPPLFNRDERGESKHLSSSSCPLSASLLQSRGFKAAAAAEPRPETREHRSAAAERPDVSGGEQRFRPGGVRCLISSCFRQTAIL